MKRIIATLLVICTLTALLVACSGRNQPGNENANNPGSKPSNNSSATVTITLPSWFVEGEDDFDADAYAKEQGFDKAVINSDGSITITTTQAKYDELLAETVTELEKFFAELINSEDTPYIKDVTHNDDFSSVTVKVDRAAYESSFDFTHIAIGAVVSAYQALLEKESHCEISIVDVDTGDVVKTTVYPDDFET